jgi:hypothetical protein
LPYCVIAIIQDVDIKLISEPKSIAPISELSTDDSTVQNIIYESKPDEEPASMVEPNLGTLGGELYVIVY